jgi:predicted aspartyl protease
MALALFACGPSKPAATASTVPALQTAVDAPRSRRADFDYRLGGHPFASPVIRAKVGGIETNLMIDTGANSHMISAWLARRAGLELQSMGDSGTDHAGKTIHTSRTMRPNIVLETWGALPDQPTLVAEMPTVIERLGIGGFISPQQLATEDAFVVLDLERAEMRTASKEEVDKLSGRVLGKGAARVCVDDSTPLRARSFVVKGQVEDMDVELLVDTGAAMTDLLTTSEVGKALLPRTVENKDDVYTASGKVKPRVLKNAKLTLGEVESTVDVNVLGGGPDAFCPRDGVVAMDVLRHCVLVFGPTSMSGFCK